MPRAAGVEGRTRLKIHAPLLRHSARREIVKLAPELGLDFGLTHSCYDPGRGRPSVRRSAIRACCGARDSKRPALKIAELFYSHAGRRVAGGRAFGFIRTSGCNLRCSWCDTPYTSWQPEGVDLTLDQIVDEVRAHPARHVVVTGGEPMIAPEIVPLTQRLRDLGLHITIETAGTVFHPGGVRPDEHQSRSCPTPRRRAAAAAQHERLRIQPAVLAELMARYDYQLKFVIEKPADLEEVRALVARAGGRSSACHPDAGGHGRRPPCGSAASGWRRSARKRASGSARGCMWTCTATGGEFEMGN